MWMDSCCAVSTAAVDLHLRAKHVVGTGAAPYGGAAAAGSGRQQQHSPNPLTMWVAGR